MLAVCRHLHSPESLDAITQVVTLFVGPPGGNAPSSGFVDLFLPLPGHGLDGVVIGRFHPILVRLDLGHEFNTASLGPFSGPAFPVELDQRPLGYLRRRSNETKAMNFILPASILTR
jgi:hypothetical protein